jgi:hypothetical protein
VEFAGLEAIEAVAVEWRQGGGLGFLSLGRAGGEQRRRRGWRKPRGWCAIPEDHQPAYDVGMARAVPAGWRGRLESATSVQKAAEARRQEAAMDLRYGDAARPVSAAAAKDG